MKVNEQPQFPRTGMPGEPPRAELTALVINAYRETPGLNLTIAQVARLFRIPETTCGGLLDDLVQQRILRRSYDGRYSRV